MQETSSSIFRWSTFTPLINQTLRSDIGAILLNKTKASFTMLFNKSIQKCSLTQRYFSSESLSACVLGKIGSKERLTPIERGYQYLVDTCHVRRCFQPSVSRYSDFRTIYQSPFPEIFDTCLILDLLHGKQLDSMVVEAGLRYILDHQGSNKLFCFFEDATLLPQDVDDTSLAMIVLMRHQKSRVSDIKKVSDAVIANVNEGGVIQTYFPPREGRDGRVDPSVCANALRFIHGIGRGSECLETENYLYAFLEKMTHLNHSGDLYYGNQAFFYFMWEAIKTSHSLKARFGSLFVERVIAHIGSSSNPIDLASRMMVLTEMDLPNYREVDKLYQLQQEDGSWPIDVAYTGSRKNLYWGSKKVSTAFALHALDCENVARLNHHMRSLPVLSNGFQVVGGYLKYTSSFSPLSLKFRIIVVTHTETPASLTSNFYATDKGSPHNLLTEKGKQEAYSIAKLLKKDLSDSPVAIFHADNKRTSETAEIIESQFPDATPTCASWLNEINCSGWLGQETRRVLEADFSAQAMFLKSDCLAKSPSGESFLELLNTVYIGLRDLQNHQLKENTVIILCSSRVNLVAIKTLLRKEVDVDSDGHIDWSTMAKKIKAGTIFAF